MAGTPQSTVVFCPTTVGRRHVRVRARHSERQSSRRRCDLSYKSRELDQGKANFGEELFKKVWIISHNVRCGAAICAGSSQECQHGCERVIGLELLWGSWRDFA